MKYKKTYALYVTVEVEGPDCTDIMEETGRKVGKHALSYDLIGIRGSGYESLFVLEGRMKIVKEITTALEAKAVQKLMNFGLDSYERKALSMWRPLP